MTPTTTGTDSTLTSSPLPNSPDADTTTNNYSNPRTQFQSVDEKKRNRHHRNNRRPRRKRSTLSATREQRNVHKKAPDYFDVEATLHEGSVAIIRLSHTPTGWKDSIMSVVEISPTFAPLPSYHSYAPPACVTFPDESIVRRSVGVWLSAVAVVICANFNSPLVFV